MPNFKEVTLVFFDIFKDLCNKRGISTYKACTDIGLNRSSVAKWKAGSIPNGATLNLLADYFGVSTDYLLGNKKEPTPKDELSEKDKRDIARDLETLMEDLENSGDLMFDGDPASPEAVDSIRNAMAMALEYAKKINKEKYTPKKYKK